MLILGLTSSTAVVGVAVANDGEILASRHVTTDRRHAEEITPLISAVLAEAGAGVADLDLLAVDVGPGRFTGLRVGVATVRGLALALDAEVVGVSSLELLAASVEGADDRPVVAVVDARRNEVFQQGFGPAATEPQVGPPQELREGIPPHAVVLGDGADRYRDLYGAQLVEGRNPSAATLVALAAGRPSEPGRNVDPLYLRDPDVQVNIKTRASTPPSS